MSIKDSNIEGGELEVLQLKDENGSVIDCVVIADMELEGQSYVALQVFDENTVPEQLDVILCKLLPDQDDPDFETIEILDEGEEFDKVSAAFESAFEAVIAGETEE